MPDDPDRESRQPPQDRRGRLVPNRPVTSNNRAGPWSGAPSSSWNPLKVSGSSVARSRASGTPSRSLSSSGQPSSSRKPSGSSAASTHRSNGSSSVSPSMSPRTTGGVMPHSSSGGGGGGGPPNRVPQNAPMPPSPASPNTVSSFHAGVSRYWTLPCMRFWPGGALWWYTVSM
jgi:hypothetical protein